MVPSDPDELTEAIHAALTRSRDRVQKDRQSVAAGRLLDAAKREAGLSALDSVLRSADEVQKALAESLSDTTRRQHEPRSQT
jgi:pilus assembly protein TadC